eukprot:jgi/Chrzof1/255/Cz01g08280.t1
MSCCFLACLFHHIPRLHSRLALGKGLHRVAAGMQFVHDSCCNVPLHIRGRPSFMSVITTGNLNDQCVCRVLGRVGSCCSDYD